MQLSFLSYNESRALARFFYSMLPLVQYQPEVTSHFEQEYDYIVAGGGSAGSVVASRLTEDPYVKVLLLEAGGKVDPITEIPGTAFLTHQTENDWQYFTTPQKRAGAAFPNNQIPVPRGKGLGGSSLLNALIYVRGNKRDYDQWEKNGAMGWSWNDVYPYFLKSENNTDPEISQNGYHSTDGLLTVSSAPYTNEVKEAFAAAAHELGYEYLDINGEKQTGFAKVQGTIRNGRRCSTAKAFLIPAEDRPNLHIVNGAFVQKVLINSNKEAYGIRFQKDGEVHDISVRKEVILSGGSIDSPKILMLSGIGPKDHLQDLGIKVIADLPVGNNLQDHVGNIALNFETEPTWLFSSPEDALLYCSSLYKSNATGPFSDPNGIQEVIFFNTKYNDPKQDWPNLEVYFLSSLAFEPIIISKDVGTTSKVHSFGENTYLLFPCLLRPKTRGTIRLKSDDPYAYPLIDLNLFEYEEDLEKVIDGMKQSMNIVTNTTSFKKIGAKMSTKPLPGCEMHEIYSDDYLRCVAKDYAMTTYHPSGTCKMGDVEDETTVVDAELKVKGIKNLRVVDASIMPTVVSGNLNAPVIMIAEKASDMIKKDNPDRMKSFKGDDARIKKNRWKRD